MHCVPCSDGQSLKLHPTYRRPRSLVRSCLEFHEFEWVQSGLNPLAYSTHVYGTLATAIAERRAEIREVRRAAQRPAVGYRVDTYRFKTGGRGATQTIGIASSITHQSLPPSIIPVTQQN